MDMRDIVAFVFKGLENNRLSKQDAHRLLQAVQQASPEPTDPPADDERQWLGGADGSAPSGRSEGQLLLAHPAWSREPLTEPAQGLVDRAHVIVLGPSQSDLGGPLDSQLPAARCVVLDAFPSAAVGYTEAAAQLLAYLQALLAEQRSTALIQLVIGSDEYEYAGLSGLLASAVEEVPALATQLLELEGGSAQQRTQWVIDEASSNASRVRRRDNQRDVSGYTVGAEPTHEATALPWRDGGVYLISGGAGGLGYRVAESITASTRHPIIVLTGRRSLDDHKRQAVRALQQRGATVEYVAVDVSDAAAVASLVDDLRQRHGDITGIIHAAGMVADERVAHKTEAQLRSVLAPKVAGVEALDQATADQALDLFVFFSSLAGVYGNAGQADYAAANGYLDAFAERRAAQVEAGVRSGRTVSIAWPLWLDGGMDVDKAVREQMWHRAGLVPLTPEEGLVALAWTLTQSAQPHMVVLKGDEGVIRGQLLGGPHAARGDDEVGVLGQGWRPGLKGLSLQQCVLLDLKEQAAGELMLAQERLTADENLSSFGFDSIALTRFANRLYEHFGIEITPGLFFSYPTLASLADYMLAQHAARLESFYARVSEQPSEAPVRSAPDSQRGAPPSAESSVESQPANTPEPLAIIGLSGRFPGASTVDALWSLLRDEVEAVETVDGSRFDVAAYYGDPEDDTGVTNGKWLGHMRGVAEFDPLFFRIAPAEAERMDPRQRLLLQASWSSLEDAGYGPYQLRGHSMGVFAGVEQGDYQELLGSDVDITGNHDGVLAARLAYILDFDGPALAINTSCSSGLVALHQACHSIRSGECDTALVGSAHLILTPSPLVGMGQAGMLSPSGRCRSFDTQADGMVPGEAVVSLVVKRLTQAQTDGDPIHGVIRGSGVNYDGHTNGLTAPSGAAQSRLLRHVYQQANIEPSAIEHIVTHGTGTPLGDPIEVNALAEVFNEDTAVRGQQTALTSTKTNLGHTQAASGLVSLVALLEGMRNEAIPASLHCEHESDYIDWSSSPFYVNKTLTPWPARASARLGAVSAFGFSGTNAHAVLASYEQPAPSAGPAPFYLLVLSAHSENALRQRVSDLAATLELGDWPAHWLAAMSYTLLMGRWHFAHRAAFVVADRDDAIRVLRAHERGQNQAHGYSGRVPREFEAHQALVRYAHQLLVETADAVDAATRRDNLIALADLYCQGYELDWERLFGDQPPRRIRLPTYPFSGERYWPDQVKPSAAPRSTQVGMPAHPLVHENTSNIVDTRFTTTLSGDEFFVADHQVGGSQVMPAAAYLEMARAAIQASLERDPLLTGGVRLADVLFAQTLVIDDSSTAVHVAVEARADGGIGFEVYTGAGDASVVHAEGRAYVEEPRQPEATGDVARLITSCTDRFTGEGCYEAFAAKGMHYGPTHRVVEELAVGDGLVVASLARQRTADRGDYVLDPAMLDGALQAPIGLSLGVDSDSGVAHLPFAVESVVAYTALPDRGWAIVRDAGVSGGVRKLDVDVVDNNERFCAELIGFTARVGTPDHSDDGARGSRVEENQA